MTTYPLLGESLGFCLNSLKKVDKTKVGRVERGSRE